MPTDRTDFLREYYRLLTDDIRRSERSLFVIVAIELAVILFLLVAVWDGGPIYLAVLLALITNTWGMHALISANLWARRSHLLAANVEREFFDTHDMDTLLPRSYYSDARIFRYRRIFRSTFLLSCALFAMALILTPLVKNPRTAAVFIFAALLISTVYVENRNCAKQYLHLVAHAPGRPME